MAPTGVVTTSGPGRALRPTGRCVQSWVAHHGSGAEPQKKILHLKRFFRDKHAYSEDVKHLVQKPLSRETSRRICYVLDLGTHTTEPRTQGLCACGLWARRPAPDARGDNLCGEHAAGGTR